MLELRSSSITAKFSPWGAKLLSCVVDGVEVTFGPGADPEGRNGDLYAGAIVGRHAGRITNARFPIDGTTIHVTPNMDEHQLHGGANGFHAREWKAAQRGNEVTFALHSPDGDEGYPGAVDATATYALSGNTLSLAISATTTRPTLVNLTNHAYWNLAGGHSVLGHDLQINGDHYFPLSDLLLPTGEIAAVADTPLDFRNLRPIAGDYDACFLLREKRGEFQHALKLRDPKSGRTLDVWTSQGCVQMYTAIKWLPAVVGRHGPLQRSSAFAIEPQNVADAPNHTNFPSSILRPGETYQNRMEWRFS